MKRKNEYTTSIYNTNMVELSGSTSFCSSTGSADDATSEPTSYEQQVAEAETPQVKELTDVVANKLGKTTSFPLLYASLISNKYDSFDLYLTNGYQFNPSFETGPRLIYQGKDGGTDPEAARHCRHLQLQRSFYSGEGRTEKPIMVGGPELLQMFQLSPEQRAAAERALNEGGIVGSSSIVDTGSREKLTLDFRDYNYTSDTSDPEIRTMTKTEELPFAASLPELYGGGLSAPRLRKNST